LQRDNAELHTVTYELVRLVRMYQEPWEKKGSQISKLLEEHGRLKNQLELTLRQLTMAAGKADPRLPTPSTHTAHFVHRKALSNYMR
jgi:predicted deacylase